ncbi:MAG: hypothetical protein FWG65_05515 [Turicibacter sp.]|nr:hypothetical protein [Turicibacter sp.]
MNSYSFPVDTTNKPYSTDKLWNLRPFLKEPTDLHIIDSILEYNVPHSFKISGKNLHIQTFDVDLNDTLLPFKGFLDMMPPHLAALLYEASMIEEFDMSDLPTISDIATITETALSCKDIFVIYIRTSMNEAYAAMLKELLETEELPNETLEDYKTRISAMLDHKMINQITAAKANLDGCTRETLIAIIRQIYLSALPFLSKTTTKIINDTISKLLTTRSTTESKSHFRRRIYALPTNNTVYEDTGDFPLIDLAQYMEKYHETDYANFLNAINALLNDKTRNQDWYEQIKRIKIDLLKATRQKSDFYMAQGQEWEIVSLIDSIIADLRDSIATGRKAFIPEYLANITEQEMNKYLSPANGVYPFSHKGTVIINTEACRDENLILAAVKNAKRLILLGSSTQKGFFRLFLQIALKQKKGVLYDLTSL